MLANLVKVAVPTPGTVDVGSVVPLGAADTGFVTFHTAFGVGQPAFFVLSDGAGRTLFGIWVTGSDSGGAPIATVQEIIWNARTNSIAAENFSGACTAWCEVPAQRFPLLANKVAKVPGSMSGGPYGLNQSAVTLLGLTIPAGTRSFDVFAGMNWLNSHSAPVAVLVAAALRNAGDTADQQNSVITRGTQISGSYGFAWGVWTVTLGGPLAEARTLHLRAYTEAAPQIAQAHNLFAFALCLKD